MRGGRKTLSFLPAAWPRGASLLRSGAGHATGTTASATIAPSGRGVAGAGSAAEPGAVGAEQPGQGTGGASGAYGWQGHGGRTNGVAGWGSAKIGNGPGA